MPNTRRPVQKWPRDGTCPVSSQGEVPLFYCGKTDERQTGKRLQGRHQGARGLGHALGPPTTWRTEGGGNVRDQQEAGPNSACSARLPL